MDAISPSPSGESGDTRLSEGDRLAAPWHREVTRKARELSRTGSRGVRLVGHRVLRHLAFHRARLASVYQSLEVPERRVISALPYLLDVNRSGLPGYVRDRRPLDGVQGFEANPTLRDAVAALFDRDVSRRALSRHKPPIRSIFVGGCPGTLIDGGEPAMTAYVVVDLRQVGDTALTALQSRGEGIAEWSAGLGLGLDFVFLDTARLAAGEFGGLRSAPARSRHALDRFYRTAIYLAGQMPVWWCIPAGTAPDQHRRMARSIERSITDLELFDAGPVPPVPARLRLRAAVEALDEGARHPLPFIVDLAHLVLDIDREQEPSCDRLKRAIEGGETPILDPVLQRVDEVSEGFRRRGDDDKADILRRLTWLKVGLYLARTTTHRGTFLDRFHGLAGPCVTRWGYDRALLELLDGLVGWPRGAVDGLDRAIRGLLLGLYAALTEAARDRPGDFDQGAVASLGRRMLAIIGVEPGRVRAHFHHLIGESRPEDHLVLLEQPDAARRERWVIHRHVIARTEDAPDRSGAEGEDAMWAGESLAAAGAWSVVNGVFGSGTAVRPVGGSQAGTAADLRDVFDRLRFVLGRPDPISRSGSWFREARRIRRAAIVASVDASLRLEGREQAAIKVLPENWDILNYGPDRVSRLRDVSVVSLDTWDGAHCRRFRGPHALMAALRVIYGDFDPATPFEINPEVLVPQGSATRAVRNRLRQILKGADRIVHTGRAGRRAFVYEVGGRFQVLVRDDRGVRVSNARSLRGGARLLGAVGEHVQHLTIDRLSPGLGELRAIVERQRSDPTAEICVGWRHADGRGQILICDEVGRIYSRQVALRQLEGLLLRLVRRIIHRLRTRVRDTRTLRRVLRVFEMRDGGSLGEDVQLREDTVRVISRLAEPRARHPELFLRGHLSRGRDGVYIEYDDRKFDPRSQGRRFAVALLEAMIADRERYAQFDLFIEASSVRFGDAAGPARERGVVKHLRLIDLYERHLARALKAMRDNGPAVMLSERRFSRGDRRGAS